MAEEKKNIISSVVTLNKWVQRLMYTTQTEKELNVYVEPAVMDRVVRKIESAQDLVESVQQTIDYQKANK